MSPINYGPSHKFPKHFLSDFCLFYLFTLGTLLCRFNEVQPLSSMRFFKLSMFIPYCISAHSTLCLLCVLNTQLHMRNLASRASILFRFPLKMSNWCLIAQFESRIRFIWQFCALIRNDFSFVFEQRTIERRVREMETFKIGSLCGWSVPSVFASMPVAHMCVLKPFYWVPRLRINKQKRNSWLPNCIRSHNQPMAHSSFYASDVYQNGRTSHTNAYNYSEIKLWTLTTRRKYILMATNWIFMWTNFRFIFMLFVSTNEKRKRVNKMCCLCVQETPIKRPDEKCAQQFCDFHSVSARCGAVRS